LKKLSLKNSAALVNYINTYAVDLPWLVINNQ
jgi:hypothetical protein